MKLEQALGEEQACLFAGAENNWAAQPLPDGPMTVGIDGGMVRARHKAGFFEVIAGKSIVAFKRDEAEEIPQPNASDLCRPMTKSRGEGCGS